MNTAMVSFVFTAVEPDSLIASFSARFVIVGTRLPVNDRILSMNTPTIRFFTEPLKKIP